MPPRKPQTLPDCITEGNGRYQCALCASDFKSWVEHVKGKIHIRNVNLAAERRQAQEEIDRIYASAEPATLQAIDDQTVPFEEPHFDITAGDSSYTLQAEQRGGGPSASDLAAAAAWLGAGQGETVEQYLARLEDAVQRLIFDTSWLHLEDGIADDDEGVAHGSADDLDEEEDDDAGTVDDPEYDQYADLQAANQSWFPYPNKTLLLIDILTSLPRLRLSDAQVRMILWVMKETGSRDVPSLSALKKLKKRLRVNCAPSTVQHTSELGNVFFTNSARETFALEMANPQIAKEIRLYPELKATSISEGWR